MLRILKFQDKNISLSFQLNIYHIQTANLLQPIKISQK